VFFEQELRQLGVIGFFDFVIFSSDFGYLKFDSRIFQAGAENLKLPNHEILYIGDSWDNDINPSRGIGMKAMHVEEAWRQFGVA
jgi:putative hydrolase of the HAD superfamily